MHTFGLVSAGAISAMVSKDIVHRDLKPQNILLSHDGRTRNPHPQDIKLKIGKLSKPIMCVFLL